MRINTILGVILALAGVGIAGISASGRAMVVMSDSMAPTFRAGDVLILDLGEGVVDTGQIITFRLQGKLITHRVVEVIEGAAITQGDGNSGVDPWTVPVGDIIGRPIVRLPLLGYAVVLLRRPIGWILLVVVPAIWVVMSQVRSVASALHNEATK